MEFTWIALTVIPLFYATFCSGLPARGCPKYQTTFYVPDDVNRCVYYQCRNGQFVGGPRRCEPGRGLSLFYSSDANPCRVKVTNCLSQGISAGGGVNTVSVPPPTKNLFTYRPPTTSPTTASLTEIIRMTTEDEMEDAETTKIVLTTASVMKDMTTATTENTSAASVTEGTSTASVTKDTSTASVTEDTSTEMDFTTEEPGSGDGEEMAPSGVYFDKGTDGGVEWPATDFNGCLKACSSVKELCWGLTWDGVATCQIYLSGLGEQCGPLTSKKGSAHMRFRCSL